jgi:hypothetical protein
MFINERDRARARGDRGVERSLTADLLRLGVPSEATLLSKPKTAQAAVAQAAASEQAEAPKKRAGRPPKPRCEHGNIADRCEDCTQAEIEDLQTQGK